MSAASQSDLRDILAGVRTIAIIGLSADPARPSNEVAAFLVQRGYDCIGVNPRLVGRCVHRIPIVARLADIDRNIDMVDIFRAPQAIGDVVDEALALDPLPRVIWMQLGLQDEDAKARAEARGLTVVMNNCPKLVLAG